MRGENRHYHTITAISALVLTAVAISASIIYALRSPQQEIYINERKPHSSSVTSAATFDKSGRFTTPYGTFTPIEHVMDVNEYMINNPVILTKEQTAVYVTYDGSDTEGVMAMIQALSDNICQGLDNDIDRAYAIAMWVGTNLVYDYDAAGENADLSVTCLKSVLDNEYRTTCGGFANMYSALCSAQGIYCLNMKGGASSEGYSRAELRTTPANHEWNAVLIDGKWYFADCTWICDRGIENGEETGGTVTREFYSMFNFGQMSVEHRIDRCEFRDYPFQRS